MSAPRRPHHESLPLPPRRVHTVGEDLEPEVSPAPDRVRAPQEAIEVLPLPADHPGSAALAPHLGLPPQLGPAASQCDLSTPQPRLAASQGDLSPPRPGQVTPPPRHSFRLVDRAGRFITEVHGACDQVEEFVQRLDEGIFDEQGIPAATTDIDGTWVTTYALVWNERFLDCMGYFSLLGVPEGAEITLLRLTDLDSVVTRPSPHRGGHTANEDVQPREAA